MKKMILSFVLAAVTFSCTKNNPSTEAQPVAKSENAPQTDPAPYGKSSLWKCIGGDTTFTEILKLDLYYTERKPGCDIFYYEMNYPIWSEYDYNIQVSECTQQKDTLFITDFNSSKIVAFVRMNLPK
jgi:hypothetical protein